MRIFWATTLSENTADRDKLQVAEYVLVTLRFEGRIWAPSTTITDYTNRLGAILYRQNKVQESNPDDSFYLLEKLDNHGTITVVPELAEDRPIWPRPPELVSACIPEL